MKQTFTLTLLLCICISLTAQNVLFRDNHITSVYIQMPADSVTKMIDQKIKDRYLRAKFICTGDTINDTIATVGIRLSGNTSLNSFKKTFKISFNEFTQGGRYRGLRKLILRGQAVDPTMIREALYYTVWNKFKLPKRRVGFAKLYINGEYRGLYTNIEDMDKEWIQQNYTADSGNLYKCTWPADLAYIGPDQQQYKDIYHDSETRAYELKTNESADNYSDLVTLITKLNLPNNANFESEIRSILNVEGVLKAFAMDVCFGNWDDYFYLKNNYFLYFNPTTQKFDFIVYDTDNSAGINWITGEDWGTRNALTWYNTAEARPLATKLLAVPKFRRLFVDYLDTINKKYTNPDSINKIIDKYKTLITPAAFLDTYKQLDWGYTNQSFISSFDQPLDSHTPYGLKPFFATRKTTLYSQIGQILSTPTYSTLPFETILFPNPSSHEIHLNTSTALTKNLIYRIYDNQGRLVDHGVFTAPNDDFTIPTYPFSKGHYFLQLIYDQGIGILPFQKL